MQISNFGETYNVRIWKSQYKSNGNLALALVCDNGEPYGNLTVNLDESLAENMAYVDTNNMPNAEEFINKYKLGEPTGESRTSGFCTYPLYKFYSFEGRE